MMRFLVCALFLCKQAEVGFADQMICGGDKCYQLHQEAVDYRDALMICRGSAAELVTGSGPEVWTLLDGKNGSYWSDAVDASMDMCRRVDATDKTTAETRCDAEADGFVCRLPLNDPCDPLGSDPSAHTLYSAHSGAELIHSELFPAGTTALTFKSSSKYPDSKHICASKWMRAPWSCEVERGGCEHACNGTCVCPPDKVLHRNRFSCTDDSCDRCEHRCESDGKCACKRGYRLQRDGTSCVDVDECSETSPCTGDGERCVNTQGAYECTCMEDFDEYDGKCVNNSICFHCEHQCEMVGGVLACVCDKGFEVSPKDPHKCEMRCTARDCPARCTRLPDMDEKDWPCTCPQGYILDYRNHSQHICTDIDECHMDMYCDHMCENLFGSFRCLCEEGFQLVALTKCVPLKMDDEDGSGSKNPPLEVPTAQPALVPSYIKTGSILGLTLFSGLCVVLLFFVVRQLAKRCDTLDILPVKRTEVDVDYLQQVTTDTYKMLPVD